MNNRKGIKSQARDYLSENRRWLTLFVTYLPIWFMANGCRIVLGVISDVNNRVWEGADRLLDAQNTIFDSIDLGISWTSLLLAPFVVAVSGYFLEALRKNPNVDFSFPYKEGAKNYGKYFVVDFVTSLVIGLWSLLFIIPGIVKAYEFSQVKFIIHDNPKLSYDQVRYVSSRMTKGYKGELFALDLSFIPWYIFGAITCGIGYAYVVPYVYTVKAMYYENLKAFAIQNGTVHPADFGIIVPTEPESYVAPQPASYEYNPEHIDFVETNYEDDNVASETSED